MRTDQLNRRLRTARPQPSGKRLQLTDADLEIFKAIHRHGPLPTHFLYEFTKHLRKDYTHLQNRLTEFYNGDRNGAYLSRPAPQFASYEARYQHLVYTLAKRARAVLAEREILSEDRAVRADPFVHQLMQACVGASFELGAPQAGLTYISRGEILQHERCPRSTRQSANPLRIATHASGISFVVPDDLFGVRHPSAGYKFYALEVDRNTESISRRGVGQTSFARKLIAYRALMARQAWRSWWGIPNLQVLTVTTSAQRARNLARAVKEHIEPELWSRFAFRSEECFGADWRLPPKPLSTLFSEPWMTADAPSYIARGE